MEAERPGQTKIATRDPVHRRGTYQNDKPLQHLSFIRSRCGSSSENVEYLICHMEHRLEY
jgi:hypothetical protein